MRRSDPEPLATLRADPVPSSCARPRQGAAGLSDLERTLADFFRAFADSGETERLPVCPQDRQLARKLHDTRCAFTCGLGRRLDIYGLCRLGGLARRGFRLPDRAPWRGMCHQARSGTGRVRRVIGLAPCGRCRPAPSQAGTKCAVDSRASPAPAQGRRLHRPSASKRHADAVCDAQSFHSARPSTLPASPLCQPVHSHCRSTLIASATVPRDGRLVPAGADR